MPCASSGLTAILLEPNASCPRRPPQRSRRMMTDFEVGVPLVSAWESRGTSTLVSGK